MEKMFDDAQALTIHMQMSRFRSTVAGQISSYRTEIVSFRMENELIFFVSCDD